MMNTMREIHQEIFNFDRIIGSIDHYLSRHNSEVLDKEVITGVLLDHGNGISRNRLAALAAIFDIPFSTFKLDQTLNPAVVESAVKKSFQDYSDFLDLHISASDIGKTLLPQEMPFSDAFAEVCSLEHRYRTRFHRPSSIWLYLSRKYSDSSPAQT